MFGWPRAPPGYGQTPGPPAFPPNLGPMGTQLPPQMPHLGQPYPLPTSLGGPVPMGAPGLRPFPQLAAPHLVPGVAYPTHQALPQPVLPLPQTPQQPLPQASQPPLPQTPQPPLPQTPQPPLPQTPQPPLPQTPQPPPPQTPQPPPPQAPQPQASSAKDCTEGAANGERPKRSFDTVNEAQRRAEEARRKMEEEQRRAKEAGAGASLRAAAALSPHRGFYHGSSPQRRPSRAQTTSGRLAWADAPPLDDEVEPEVVPAAAGQQPTAEPLETEEPISTGDPGTPLEVAPADLSELTAKSSPSWKRLEKTVTEYVSRRNVTSSEYEQVRQRYEGHLNELKTLCETLGPVGRPAWSDRQAERRPKTEREKRGALNFRELHDEKALLQRSSCSPRQAPRKPGGGHSGHQRSPTSRKGSEKGTVEGPAEEVEEKSVVPPLLSARMLSAVPMARLHQDNDLEHVRSLFCAQVPEAQLLSIYRVENPTLEGVYSAVRDAMGSESCELDLWHGTSCECVPNIVLNGFNRAYSGRRHGTKLGHGSYFSASAAYSTRFCDRKRHRRTVFFAKVLVGEWAKGSPDLVEPPCKDAEGLLRYDCTVDDTESPVNFCIFRDFQAMPTYLLEFTTELRGRDQRTMTTRAS